MTLFFIKHKLKSWKSSSAKQNSGCKNFMGTGDFRLISEKLNFWWYALLRNQRFRVSNNPYQSKFLCPKHHHCIFSKWARDCTSNHQSFRIAHPVYSVIYYLMLWFHETFYGKWRELSRVNLSNFHATHWPLFVCLVFFSFFLPKNIQNNLILWITFHKCFSFAKIAHISDNKSTEIEMVLHSLISPLAHFFRIFFAQIFAKIAIIFISIKTNLRN